jgi:hypothetical protein
MTLFYVFNQMMFIMAQGQTLDIFKLGLHWLQKQMFPHEDSNGKRFYNQFKIDPIFLVDYIYIIHSYLHDDFFCFWF